MQPTYGTTRATFPRPSILCIAVLTACQAVDPSPPETTIDVLIVAGQSNAVGFDAPAAELPADSADLGVRFWWRVGDPPPDEFDSTSGSRAWRDLSPQPKGTPRPKENARRQYGNFKSADGGFGPEMGLVRRLAQGRSGSRLAVIKVAFSGTNLKDDWRPAPEARPEAGEVGACYRSLVQETRLALAAAREEGWTPRLRGLCWIQGESDSGPAASEAYAANMEGLITALRRDLNAPELPVLMALNTRFGKGKNPGVAAVANAQRLVASQDERAMYVDTAAATVANGAHFDAPGTLDVGRWFAEALLALEGEGTLAVDSTASDSADHGSADSDSE